MGLTCAFYTNYGAIPSLSFFYFKARSICCLLSSQFPTFIAPYGITEADRLKVSELGLVWGNGELPYFDNITSSSTENQQTTAQLLAGALTGQLS